MVTNGKAISTVTDALRSQPLALALVLINILFVIVGFWSISRIGDSMRARDAALIELLKDCRKG